MLLLKLVVLALAYEYPVVKRPYRAFGFHMMPIFIIPTKDSSRKQVQIDEIPGVLVFFHSHGD